MRKDERVAARETCPSCNSTKHSGGAGCTARNLLPPMQNGSEQVRPTGTCGLLPLCCIMRPWSHKARPEQARLKGRFSRIGQTHEIRGLGLRHGAVVPA